MKIHTLAYTSTTKLSVLCLLVATSPNASAISEYIETQNPHTVSALIYGLLCIMTLLLIAPIWQFYFTAIRAQNHEKEQDQLNSTNTENKILKDEIQAIKHELEHIQDDQPSAESDSGNLVNDIDIAVLEGQCDAAQGEISALLSQVNSLKQCICEKDQSIEVLDHQLSILEAEQENATGFIAQLIDQVAAQKKAMSLAEQKNQALAAHSDNQEIIALQSQLDQLTKESMRKNDNLVKENAAINNELFSTKIALDKAKHKVAELSRSSERLELENKQQENLIDSLMEQLTLQKQAS